MSEQPIGSYYGEDLYSAGLYSWLRVWFQIACDPVTVRAAVPPGQYQAKPTLGPAVSEIHQRKLTYGH